MKTAEEIKRGVLAQITNMPNQYKLGFEEGTDAMLDALRESGHLCSQMWVDALILELSHWKEVRSRLSQDAQEEQLRCIVDIVAVVKKVTGITIEELVWK